MFRTLKWEDWAGIGLGVWLIMSPWTLGFADQWAPALNALIMGTVLVLDEMLEVVVHELAEEWLDLAVGVWLVISPFVLGFSTQMAASANAVAVGLLTMLFAAWAISPLDATLARWWRDHVTGH